MLALVVSAALAAPPPLPPLPPGLDKTLPAAERKVAEYARRCFTEETRNPGPRPAACTRRGQALAAMGPAGRWAILEAVLDVHGGVDAVSKHLPEGEVLTLDLDSVHELLAVLKPTADSELVQALVHALPGLDGDHFGAVGELLFAITGRSYWPQITWYRTLSDNDDTFTPAVAEAWAAWCAAECARSPAEWRTDSRAAALTALAGSDAKARVAAAWRLAQADGDPALARTVMLADAVSDPVALDKAWDDDLPQVEVLEALGLPPAEVEALRVRVDTIRAEHGDADARERNAQRASGAKADAARAACERAFYALALDEALAQCNAALEATSEDPAEAYVLRGWVNLELGHTEDAGEDAQSAAGHVGGGPQLARAFQLIAAVATVQGDVEGAREALKNGVAEGGTRDLRVRQALLAGKPPTAAWTQYVGPRWFCWARKGKAAADAYLLRRGLRHPEAFDAALAALPDKVRARLESKGQAGCPFPAAQGSAARARAKAR